MDLSELMGLGGLYRNLGLLFYFPDKEELKTLGVFDLLSEYIEQFQPNLTRYVISMRDSFEACSEEELKIEFSKLFIGPYKLIAPPYGSVYLDGQSQVHGPSTVLVENHFRRHNLKVELKEPPDHIAIELEFVGILLQKCESPQLEEEILTFYTDLFEPWIDPFCDRIIEGTDIEYFSNLAKLIKDTKELTSKMISCLR